jgi:hypothetical protein
LDRLDAASPETVLDELRLGVERSGKWAGVQDEFTMLVIRQIGMRAAPMAVKSWWRALRELASMAPRSWRTLPWPERSLANLSGALIPRLSRSWSGPRGADEREK